MHYLFDFKNVSPTIFLNVKTLDTIDTPFLLLLKKLIMFFLNRLLYINHNTPNQITQPLTLLIRPNLYLPHLSQYRAAQLI